MVCSIKLYLNFVILCVTKQTSYRLSACVFVCSSPSRLHILLLVVLVQKLAMVSNKYIILYWYWKLNDRFTINPDITLTTKFMTFHSLFLKMCNSQAISFKSDFVNTQRLVLDLKPTLATYVTCGSFFYYILLYGSNMTSKTICLVTISIIHLSTCYIYIYIIHTFHTHISHISHGYLLLRFYKILVVRREDEKDDWWSKNYSCLL